jgi:hypothetical protein
MSKIELLPCSSHNLASAPLTRNLIIFLLSFIHWIPKACRFYFLRAPESVLSPSLVHSSSNMGLFTYCFRSRGEIHFLLLVHGISQDLVIGALTLPTILLNFLIKPLWMSAVSCWDSATYLKSFWALLSGWSPCVPYVIVTTAYLSNCRCWEFFLYTYTSSFPSPM